MTIEMAGRLENLRKQQGLTQGELAEKLGVSEQTVAAWERGSLAPDADQLAALAALYTVSADYLISGDTFKKEKVHVGFDGIHVENERDTVHVDRHGVHVETAAGEQVHVGTDGVRVSDDLKKYVHADHKNSLWKKFPFPMFVLIAFLIWGFVADGWWIAWTLFLLIPLYYTLVDAILDRDPNKFAYPVLVAFIYCVIGMAFEMWHPWWVLFLSVPLYYWVASMFKKPFSGE